MPMSPALMPIRRPLGTPDQVIPTDERGDGLDSGVPPFHASEVEVIRAEHERVVRKLLPGARMHASAYARMHAHEKTRTCARSRVREHARTCAHPRSPE